MYQLLELYKKEINEVFIKHLKKTTFITDNLSEPEIKLMEQIIFEFTHQLNEVTNLYLKTIKSEKLRIDITSYNIAIRNSFFLLID